MWLPVIVFHRPSTVFYKGLNILKVTKTHYYPFCSFGGAGINNTFVLIRGNLTTILPPQTIFFKKIQKSLEIIKKSVSL